MNGHGWRCRRAKTLTSWSVGTGERGDKKQTVNASPNVPRERFELLNQRTSRSWGLSAPLEPRSSSVEPVYLRSRIASSSIDELCQPRLAVGVGKKDAAKANAWRELPMKSGSVQCEKSARREMGNSTQDEKLYSTRLRTCV